MTICMMEEMRRGGGRRRRRTGGLATKNKNPTQRCGELTYGPRKAVAEVSNHNEPIGSKSGIQLVRKPMDFTFNCFVLN